jgi:cell division protein ZapB
MLNELDTLENKIGQVVTLCHNLRAENDQLREQLAVAEVDKQRLAERMGEASARLEQLAQQLPEASD